MAITRSRLVRSLLAYLGVPAKVDSFEGRLVVQKAVYFLEVFGFALGYRFTWYVYGPYSPDLARDMRESSDGDVSPDQLGLPAATQTQLAKLRAFLDGIGDDPTMFELIASLHFLQKTRPLASESEQDSILRGKRTSFSTTQIVEARRHLRGALPA